MTMISLETLDAMVDLPILADGPARNQTLIAHAASPQNCQRLVCRHTTARQRVRPLYFVPAHLVKLAIVAPNETRKVGVLRIGGCREHPFTRHVPEARILASIFANVVECKVRVVTLGVFPDYIVLFR